MEWDLSHPSNYTFNNDAIRNGVVKNGIIYGPNGAGKSNFGLALFDIANHLSHKWKKPDYYLNYACAAHYDEPVDFEYTFALDGHDVVYTYSKVAAELKGEIIREQLLIDGKEVLMKDNERLNISEEFGLTEVAIENLKESANNISLVNYLLGAVPLPKGHALLQLRDFVENMLFFRSLDNREFIGLKEGGSNIEEYISEWAGLSVRPRHSWRKCAVLSDGRSENSLPMGRFYRHKELGTAILLVEGNGQCFVRIHR